MDIKLFNSLTNKIEVFKPLKENEVNMYVCGSTVYSSPHLGNLRPIVCFDVLRRLFLYLGYKVTYVSNYTDIDDKIINRAIKENVSEMDIANRYIKEIEQLLIDINSLHPDITPRVSEYIDKIINYISNFVDTKHAYLLGGDVYFRVNSIKDYGKLSNINLDDLKVGARIDEVKNKESPFDFALWKKTDVGIKWDSPWGEGRPGWHTECVVMIDSIFNGNMIDIHGGGFDLKFPHHENEIAQAKATHGRDAAKYWIHNGFVTFGDTKMSKSLGNVILAKDAIKEHSGPVVRLALLNSHYRAPVKFNDETLLMAKNEINRIKETYSKLSVFLSLKDIDLDSLSKIDINPFIDALKDDLNISNALTYLFDVLKNTNNLLRNKSSSIEQLEISFASIRKMLDLLGLDIKYPRLTLEDKKLFNEYEISRNNKDFKRSDEIRKKLVERGLF